MADLVDVPFYMFCQENRDKFKRETPGIRRPEVEKKLKQTWDSMTPAEKMKYNNLTSAEKAGQLNKK